MQGPPLERVVRLRRARRKAFRDFDDLPRRPIDSDSSPRPADGLLDGVSSQAAISRGLTTPFRGLGAMPALASLLIARMHAPM
jgi:hypothetical protein